MLSPTGRSPSSAGLSRSFPVAFISFSAVLTPRCTHHGLGSSHFARRYFGNHGCFLFLRLLRCFSSPGLLTYTMDSCMPTIALRWWVSPFGYPRFSGYLLLPAAFRSLLRPSSALSAKASALRSSCLTSPLPVLACTACGSLSFGHFFWFFIASLLLVVVSSWMSASLQASPRMSKIICFPGLRFSFRLRFLRFYFYLDSVCGFQGTRCCCFS